MFDPDYPRLPQDLERLIFEIATEEHDAKWLSQLLLVAKRVHEWMRPIVFQVFTQHEDGPKFPDFEKHPSLKLNGVGSFAKHMILGYNPPEEINLLLSSCPNIHNLAIWHSNSLKACIPIVHTLPLTRLSAGLSDMIPDDFLGPAFRNLTHLDVLECDFYSWDKWAILTRIPKLSHLSISFAVESDIVQKLLSHCNALRVLIVLWEGNSRSDTLASSAYKYSDIGDYRFVPMVGDGLHEMLDDWLKGAHGRPDFWTAAESFILNRQRNFVNDASPKWITISGTSESN